MMLWLRYRQNIMIRSLQLLKNTYRGLTLPSSSEQLSSRESKQVPSKLKLEITRRIKQTTDGMPEQKIILSVIGQALGGIADDKLLMFIKMVNNELDELIDTFGVETQEILLKALGEEALRTLDGQSGDMASNQIGTE